MKTCTKCKLEKSFEDFGKDKHSKSGLASACKACKAKNTSKWRKQNPEKDKAYKKSEAGRESARRGTAKYRKRHPDRIQAYEQSERGKEVHRKARKRYYYKNKELENEKFKKYYQENLSKERKRRRNYYKENIEAERERFRKYAKENASYYVAKAAERRARLLKATPPWADLDKIKEIYENCPKGYAVDHIIPLKNKRVCGLHVPENLQYLTKSENSSKGNKFDPHSYQPN